MLHLTDMQRSHLSQWLTRELEPLTMAEPETLAEYVIALLNNDKVGDELFKFCEEQLSAFLTENTVPFLTSLFATLKGFFLFLSILILIAY